MSRRDEDSVPLVQNKYSLLLSGLTFEPHSPVAGKAERRLSVTSQSQGSRECCGQRGLIGLQMQGEGRRSVDLSLQWSFPRSTKPLCLPWGRWNSVLWCLMKMAGPEGAVQHWPKFCLLQARWLVTLAKGLCSWVYSSLKRE